MIHKPKYWIAAGIGLSMFTLFVGGGYALIRLLNDGRLPRLVFGLAFGLLAASCYLHQGRIRYLERDPLTGCFQRHVAYKHFSKIKKERATVCVAIIDVNNLKAVNDTYGHDAGDAVIREVADRLMSRFSKRLKVGSLVARLGGDEFLVVSSDCNPEVVGEDIEALLIQEYQGRFDIAVGGISVAHNGDWSEALAQADIAVYRAKENSRKTGKSCVFIQ